MNNMIQNNKLHTASSASHILGISRTGTLKLIREGKLKSERVGRLHIIQTSDIEKLLLERGGAGPLNPGK